MRKELDNYLVQKYPKIFINRYEDKTKTAMCWGFEHNDGWFWLIDQLCGSIQSYIDSSNNYNSEDKHVSQVVADQVKEKFGGLRFYYTGGDDYIDGMVSMAENMSYNICEYCGTTENLGTTQGWISIMCKNCHDNSGDHISKRIWVENKNNIHLLEASKELRKIKIDKLNNNSNE